MIPRSPTNCQTENYIPTGEAQNRASPPGKIKSTHVLMEDKRWKSELAASNISLDSLFNILEISGPDRQFFLQQHQVPKNFPVRATASYLRRIKKGDINDPLLRQVAPFTQELESRAGFSADPLDEQNQNPAPGLIHKYHGRVLLVVTQACAIHCRYCFRRHFPYQHNSAASDSEQALEYIRRNPSINEVILSGGDPLAASDKTLARLTHQLSTILHIKRLRIHTRIPVVLPSRINDNMLAWLQQWQGQKVLVVHANHSNEIDHDVVRAIDKLRGAGVTMLNQTVLLKGVNDCAQTLIDLSEKLFRVGILPYYLHQLDPVTGTHHFAVEDNRAKKIISDVSAHLPGFLVPKMVREIPQSKAKTLL